MICFPNLSNPLFPVVICRAAVSRVSVRTGSLISRKSSRILELLSELLRAADNYLHVRELSNELFRLLRYAFSFGGHSIASMEGELGRNWISIISIISLYTWYAKFTVYVACHYCHLVMASPIIKQHVVASALGPTVHAANVAGLLLFLELTLIRFMTA